MYTAGLSDNKEIWAVVLFHAHSPVSCLHFSDNDSHQPRPEMNILSLRYNHLSLNILEVDRPPEKLYTESRGGLRKSVFTRLKSQMKAHLTLLLTLQLKYILPRDYL